MIAFAIGLSAFLYGCDGAPPPPHEPYSQRVRQREPIAPREATPHDQQIYDALDRMQGSIRELKERTDETGTRWRKSPQSPIIPE
jgi:hypothetical protein